MRGDGGAYTTEMEADEQRQLAQSSIIPTECDRPAFEALGFVFGEQVPNDPLFQHATLPPGWHLTPDSHSGSTHILDEHGRKRVYICCKAAFYGRKADATILGLRPYLWDVASTEDGQVIYDDAWATPAAVAEAAAQEANAERDRAGEQGDLTTPAAQYHLEAAARHMAIAAAARAEADRAA